MTRAVQKIVATTTTLAAMLMLTSACNESTDARSGEMPSTITVQEANERLESHAQRAIESFPQGAKLELFRKYEERPCDDPGDSDAGGKLFASRIYEVNGLTPDSISKQFESLRHWWESNGYRILDTEENFLRVENSADGFRFALQANDDKELFLIGDSPCVWPDGTPAPQE